MEPNDPNYRFYPNKRKQAALAGALGLQFLYVVALWTLGTAFVGGVIFVILWAPAETQARYQAHQGQLLVQEARAMEAAQAQAEARRNYYCATHVVCPDVVP